MFLQAEGSTRGRIVDLPSLEAPVVCLQPVSMNDIEMSLNICHILRCIDFAGNLLLSMNVYGPGEGGRVTSATKIASVSTELTQLYIPTSSRFKVRKI